MSSQFGADSHVIDPAALPCMLSNFPLLCKLLWLLLFVATASGAVLWVLCVLGRQEGFIYIEKREGCEEVEGSAKACCFPLKKNQLNYPLSPGLVLLRERKDEIMMIFPGDCE